MTLHTVRKFRYKMASYARMCVSRFGLGRNVSFGNLSRSFSTSGPSPFAGALFSAKVQRPAPDFKGQAVVNKQFKEIKLADYKGKYVLLFFYPLDFTFVCPTEIIAFSDSYPKFKELNTEVIAVSVDSHFSHLAWINTPRKEGGLGDMQIPVLADLSKSISRNYGVLLEDVGIALRGLFLIDPNGIVKHITINDLPVGRSVDEAIRVVQAFQFVEKHGEVCPANWKPNSPTIKPDPEKAKEYFKQAN